MAQAMLSTAAQQLPNMCGAEMFGPSFVIASSAACWQGLFCAGSLVCPNATWRAKVLATLYAITVLPFAMRQLLGEVSGHMSATDEPAAHVCPLFGMAAGYYLWALVLTIFDHGIAAHPLAALHHISCFAVFGVALYDPVNVLPHVCNTAEILLISEMSTLFANLRWFAYLSIVPTETGSPQPVEPPDSPSASSNKWPAELSAEDKRAARKAQRLLHLARMFEMLFLWSFFITRVAVGLPTSMIWWLRDTPKMSGPTATMYITAGISWHLMNLYWICNALICPRGRLARAAEGKDTKTTVKFAMSIGSNPCTDEVACELSVTDALDAKVEIWFRESKNHFTRMTASARFGDEFGAKTVPDVKSEDPASAGIKTTKPVIALKLEPCTVSSTGMATAKTSPQLDTNTVSYIHGVWYDFTKFKHPGGPVALSLALHRDASALFEAHHPFTSRSKLRAVLKKYEITPGSEREAALSKSGILAENGPDPYTWDHKDVTGHSKPGEDVDAFEVELKEMVRVYFAGEAKRRGVSFLQATKATPWRWCEVGMLAALYFSTVPGLVRGEWWALFVSPLMAWVWLANMYHDACHFSLSTTWWVNAALPYTTPWLCSPTTWYHQHVVGHHAYPNIGRMDPDLAHAPQLLRHHESIRWRDSHVGQESTARTMFIWVVATLGMQVLSDMRMVSQGIYNKVVPMVRLSKARIAAHVFGRAYFLAVTFVWPFVVFVHQREVPDYRRAVLFSFVPMMIFSLLFMACSQVNHLTPNTTHGQSKNYFRHQVQTAQDFMVHSTLAFWMSGGLNLQIEHHLFPSVCHCHLRTLQPMVADMCKKHGVGYHTAPNWIVAYRQHCEHTKEMGENPDAHDDDDDHDPYEGIDPTPYVYAGLAAVAVAMLPGTF